MTLVSQNKIAGLSENLKEEVVLFTDRDLYLVGEKILFSAYVNTSDSSSINQMSKILYIELNNNENPQLVTQKIKIDSGIANGFIVNLPSGSYAHSLRFYSDPFFQNFMIICGNDITPLQHSHHPFILKIFNNWNLFNSFYIKELHGSVE